MKTLYATLTIFLLFTFTILPQSGYFYESGYQIYPDTFMTNPLKTLSIPVLKEDVKAIGMGKTQIANGKFFNAMMYNPALLNRKRTSFEVLGIQASLPPNTYNAAHYIQNNRTEFEQAFSLQEVWAGIADFQAAQDINQQLTAVKRIQAGLKFPYELSTKVIGNSRDPEIHGVRVIPSISAQIDNFGFSLYGVGQSGFRVQQSPVIEALLNVELPDYVNNLNDPATQLAIVKLFNILQVAMNENNTVSTEALPITYSTSYIDIVGAAGYGLQVNKLLGLGANIKVIHRRFSISRVVTMDYNDILNVLKRDLNSYITGVTLDLGGILTFPTGTEVALSLQNIIPVQKLNSTMYSDFSYTYSAYKRDSLGNKVLTPQGDTVLQTINRSANVANPFNLKVPILVNIGAIHPINKDWDVALDIYDMAEQDSRFNKYWERLRIGTEYRFSFEKNFFLSARLGMADLHPTYGLGLNIYNFFQIDAAYAWDNFVDENSIYAQVRFGW
ncbi:MAG TPA: hypothetical protein VFF33_01975 [Ignavibacteriaceae bacterium]|nr:hypothetical protein [Ignavibacteriaceae bacterium]